MKIELVKEVKVKPCPLCCSTAFLHTNMDGSATANNLHTRQQFWVKCDDLQCGCTINATESRDEALKRWNQRW